MFAQIGGNFTYFSIELHVLLLFLPKQDGILKKVKGVLKLSIKNEHYYIKTILSLDLKQDLSQVEITFKAKLTRNQEIFD